jgi:endonuclease YncB( thermonuclease family)
MGCSAVLKKASLVGAFFVFVLPLAPAQAFCPAPGKLPSVKVRHVVDGDTLRLEDGRSVRLIGLNAPELGRKGRAAEPFAEAARRRLRELVAANWRFARFARA